ncbi:hypothetical protein HMSSN036_05960 [Paenibacillus macerans]|nr:hypothetical protein HMSSN036_05960 [Paenibacillus macerans]
MQSTPKAESQDSGEILVDIRNVKKYFPIQKGLLSRVVGHVKAVDDVSLAIRQGETFGLVGESGVRQSTLGRVILRLQGATDGEVVFRGRDIHKLKGQELRKLREEMQIIFQDPFGSLNPRFLVRDIIGEPLRVHRNMSAKQIDERVVELMELVGLDASRRNRYPHEFSGGQRQRIGIARAIALNPKFIVADEAVSALDVSVQSQVINLLMKLQRELGLTFLFIAHGLNVVRHISDRVGVMYLGKLVEVGKPKRCLPRRFILIRPPCCRRFPNLRRDAARSALCCRGMCRRRQIRHRAAGSTPAARLPGTNAPRWSRS